ncbi:MAG: dihydrolipoyl dehydrogenase [Desulfobacterales bacterium]|nr:dihydrolipoyl dehydrogenase [Desulfobacterales bacterium]
MTKKIIIIGGGPGGYVAAIRAAQLGAQVTVVERGKLGGTCLNRGCVPTKTLLHAARIYKTVQNTRQLGIYCTIDSFRYDKMVEGKNEVVRNNAIGIETIFKNRHIKLLSGIARLSDPTTLKIETAEGKRVKESADALVIATGSEPLIPKFIKFDGDRVITTTEALDLDNLPSSIVIVGGSVSGCEFACLFGQLGSQVYLIEMLDRIVPTEDKELSRRLAGRLKRLGVNVMTKTRVESLERQYPVSSVTVFTDKDQINADYCLLAMGRKLNTENIGLETLGIDFSSEGIKTDKRMQTNVSGVYAVGDVTGKYQLAHVASEQGIIAVENIMEIDATMDYGAIPSFIYTDPEIASVGLKPEEAVEKGMDIIEGKATFKGNAMAHVIKQTSGFVKTVIDKKTLKILGVHMFGPHVTELLPEAVTMIKMDMTLADVKNVIYPHPTLSETVKESALAAAGEAIHA